jgi:uroporphyrinogen-III synthase
LITRPGIAGEQLCEMLRAAGAQAWHQPLLTVLPLGDAAAFTKQLQRLESKDLIIANSQHAVQCAQRLLDQNQSTWPTAARYLAVGPATAQAWSHFGVRNVALPTSFNSEGLLEHAWCKQKQGRVLILKGEGGRDLLESKLKARGRDVNCVSLYRRQPTNIPATERISQWQTLKINAIVVTSTELFDTLWQVLSASPGLRDTCLFLVASERIAQHAREAGARQVWLAQGANNSALFNALIHCYQDTVNLEAE